MGRGKGKATGAEVEKGTEKGGWGLDGNGSADGDGRRQGTGGGREQAAEEDGERKGTWGGTRRGAEGDGGGRGMASQPEPPSQLEKTVP